VSALRRVAHFFERIRICQEIAKVPPAVALFAKELLLDQAEISFWVRKEENSV
jgi:hypothetical protein